MGNKKGFDTLHYELEERTLVIRLNRPKVSNAISKELLADLKQAFFEAENDKEVKVVILTGEGKNFSVGADLTEAEALQSIGVDPVSWTP
jgi:enoyl-CoA hydratase/carnithine racemase